MLSDRVRSARPGKQEPPGHAADPTARPAPGPHRRRRARRRSPVAGRKRSRSGRGRGDRTADERSVDDGRRRAHPHVVRLRAASALTVVVAVAVRDRRRSRPDGALWDRLYDVVLYNAAYVCGGGRLLAGRAGGSAPSGWPGARSRSPCCSSAAGNAAAHPGAPGSSGNGPYPPVIDAARARRLPAALRHPGRADPRPGARGSTRACGWTASSARSARRRSASRSCSGPTWTPPTAAPLSVVELALPAMDVLLLALLVAVGSILGVRLDRTLVLRRRRAVCVLAGDVVLFARTRRRAPTSTAGRPSSPGSPASPRGARRAQRPAATGPHGRPSAPASAGGCSPCRWPATWPASSSSPWAGATSCRPRPPGWPSAASWPRSPAPRSPSARCAPSTRSGSRPAPTS